MADPKNRAVGNWSNSALLPDPLFSLWSQHGPASAQAAAWRLEQ